MSKYTTIQQHEPLRAPEGWGTQERRFIAQLEEILDDLYRRFNRLKMTDLGKELQTIIESDHASIEVLNDTITLVAGEGMEIGSVNITRGGITMTGGEIVLSASASLSMSSTGLVDINGATGSINLGEGSQVHATNGTFDALTINGVNYMPVIYSDRRPTLHKVFWAKPTTPPPGYSLSGGCYTWSPRTERYHGITQNYGTSFDTAQHYSFDPGSIETYTANIIRYKITVPIIRVSGSNVSRTLYAAIYRTDAHNLGRITFSGVTKTFKAGVVTNVTFETTSSTNLTQNGSDAYFSVHVWGTGATASNSVFVQADSYIDFLITDVNQSSSDEQCSIYYIP